MREGEFFDILDDLERAYDTDAKYLNFVLEHAMEDEYWFSRGINEKVKEKILTLLKDANYGN